MRRLLLAAVVSAAAAVPASAASPVVAVLSSDLDAYREGLRGFEAGFGEKVVSLQVSDRSPLPAGTKVVAAFGGRAASRPYPAGVFVISCLAPALPRAPRSGARVRMVPPPDKLLAGIRGAQPSARALAVLWSNPAFEEYARELKALGERTGPEIKLVEVDGGDDLPGRLRALRGEVDALWLAPDPDLIDQRSFALLREFSRSTRLPLFAPTLELVKEGAAASIAASFYEAGRTAGLAAKRSLAGEALPSRLYPELVESVFDAEQAARDGLRVSTEGVKSGSDPRGRQP